MTTRSLAVLIILRNYKNWRCHGIDFHRFYLLESYFLKRKILFCHFYLFFQRAADDAIFSRDGRIRQLEVDHFFSVTRITIQSNFI